MPKYTILRPFTPETTREQIDARVIRNMFALESYIYRGGSEIQGTDHGMRWVRTYWEPGGAWGMCLYESPDVDELWRFHELCGSKALAMNEVEEYGNCDRTPEVDGQMARYVVESTLEGDDAPVVHRLDTLQSAEDAPSAKPNLQWVRTYWDTASQRSVTLYLADDRGADALKTSCAATGATLRQVVEIYPDEYLHS